MEIWELPEGEGGRLNHEVVPFAGHLAWAMGPDAVYVSEGHAYEVRVYDGRGTLKAVLREDGVPFPARFGA